MRSIWIAALTCISACISLTACGGSDDDGDGDEGNEGACASTDVDTAAGNADTGAGIYLTYCSSCHGADGNGLPAAPAKGSQGINLKDEMPHQTVDCTVSVIKNGYDDMAPVAGLTTTQLNDLVAYFKRDFAGFTTPEMN